MVLKKVFNLFSLSSPLCQKSQLDWAKVEKLFCFVKNFVPRFVCFPESLKSCRLPHQDMLSSSRLNPNLEQVIHSRRIPIQIHSGFGHSREISRLTARHQENLLVTTLERQTPYQGCTNKDTLELKCISIYLGINKCLYSVLQFSQIYFPCPHYTNWYVKLCKYDGYERSFFENWRVSVTDVCPSIVTNCLPLKS